MANAYRSLKQRLVRAIRGCVTDEDSSADRVSAEKVRHSSKSNIPTRPTISGPLRSTSMANALLSPTKHTTTVPVVVPHAPKLTRTDVQIFVTLPDGYVTKPHNLPYRKPRAAMPEYNITLLWPKPIVRERRSRKARKHKKTILGKLTGCIRRLTGRPQVEVQRAKSSRASVPRTAGRQQTAPRASGRHAQRADAPARSPAREPAPARPATPAPAVCTKAAALVAFPTSAMAEHQAVSIEAAEAPSSRRRVNTARPPARLPDASA